MAVSVAWGVRTHHSPSSSIIMGVMLFVGGRVEVGSAFIQTFVEQP